MELIYEVETKTRQEKYRGCQCFKDCDCRDDYPKTISYKIIKVFYQDMILEREVPFRSSYSESSYKTLAEGMISRYEARVKNGKYLGLKVNKISQ